MWIKGILQPHHLLDELDKIMGEDEARKMLRHGSFGEVLKPAQASVCKFDAIYFDLMC